MCNVVTSHETFCKAMSDRVQILAISASSGKLSLPPLTPVADEHAQIPAFPGNFNCNNFSFAQA
jgi:hypothetical protein